MWFLFSTVYSILLQACKIFNTEILKVIIICIKLRRQFKNSINEEHFSVTFFFLRNKEYFPVSAYFDIVCFFSEHLLMDIPHFERTMAITWLLLS